MTPMTSLKPSRSQRRRSRSRSSSHPDCRVARGVLGHYSDHQGRPREILARPGYAGSVLVVDRDACTLGDRRLVAHLGADEPAENAALMCRHYLRDPRGRWCRPVTPEDLRSPAVDAIARDDPPAQGSPALSDRQGRTYRLGPLSGRLSVPELRWLRDPASVEAADHNSRTAGAQPVSVRDVVGNLESYEPVRTLTAEALARHGGDRAVSVSALRAELVRMNGSRIVLNCGLREAVLDAVEARGLSMSEIALRCGRVKYDARGNASGETSWLTRRIGLAPEGGEREPTPWVHSEVLALIARAGLGISPREVELG
jgi:hypothetical protein